MTGTYRRTTVPEIDGESLWQRLAELSMVGSATGGGVTRLALTEADAQGRRLVESWLAETGCEINHDAIGNTIAVLPGTDPSLPPVLLGSHVDSVVNAGRFDGCLGVLGAVEVLRAVAAGPRPRRSLAVAVFTDEEGTRFGRDLLGSSVTCGLIEPEEALAIADTEGKTVEHELRAHGLLGTAPLLAGRPPHAYLETHIEQGPVLLRENLAVAAVTGVVGTSWTRITLTGAAAHAGATPMEMRRDAGLAMAALRLRLHALAEEHSGLTVAVGAMNTLPQQVNVVPAAATLTVDLRAPDDAVLAKAESAIRPLAEDVALTYGCELTTCERISRTAPATFDPAMVDRVAGRIEEHGLPARRLWSGAGHDAQQLATICPTAMVFVRSQHDGISHSPEEWSLPEDCTLGVQLMAEVAIELLND
ncbi:M20 family metallo-hydrolase [Saccharopolyspora phatthalungensis]|uniref:N-carbamoyl-L-amino-acid hydrolase n=1 Tax=Saccharopolyspora phatthalungensis TaxID=664693 RepID=A0A840QIE3_9PSEU|nr:M20 family metallo-hydrolase [Saccharopolyspora phatthalungensis]MBB5159880.1 N-carbamoyl-L-amino-acid hydrolase [Saccharopolyspora phatthalungensis]